MLDSMRARMPRQPALLAAGAFLVAAVAVGLWLMNRDPGDVAEPTTATVTSGTYQSTVTGTGTLEPANEADLSFAVSGTVTRVLVREGDKVRRGEALAVLGRTGLAASLQAARSSLDAATAQHEEDLADEASDTQLAADRAQVTAAGTQLASAREELADATLRSTIAGTVVSLDLAVGDVVASGSDSSSAGAATDTTTSGASTSSSAVTVISASAFTVTADVSTSDAKRIDEGMQVEITPTGASDTVYGTVASIGLVAEASTSGAATLPVTIDVTGKQRDLYAGTSADVSVIVEQSADVLTVPTTSLHTDGDTTFVYQVTDAGRQQTTVEIGTAYGMQTEVTAGLTAGDEVEVPAMSVGGGGQPAGSGGGELPAFGDAGTPPGGGGAFPGAPGGGS